MAIPPDLLHLATLLDDEDEDVAINVIAALLDRENELGELPAMLQESPNALVRRRAHQLQAAMRFRYRRRRFYARLNEPEPDFAAGLVDLHMLWFDRDPEEVIYRKLAGFCNEVRRRPLTSLTDAEYLMRRTGIVAELETTMRPENYCIGTILDQHAGAAGILMGLLRELLGPQNYRVVRTLNEFGLYDGEGKLLLGQGDWRICPAKLDQLEFWETRAILRYAGNMLFSSAVNSDSFRYILTIAQAMSGDPGDSVLDYFPYPYRPADDSADEGNEAKEPKQQ